VKRLGRLLASLSLLAAWLSVVAPAQAEELPGKAARAKQAMIDGRYDEAAELYGEVAAELPGNPGVIANHGMALHLAGRYAEAVKRLEEAVRLDPRNAMAHLLLGTGYLKQNQAEKAIRPLDEAVRLEPGNLLARLQLATASYAAGRFEQAAHHAARATRQDPDNARAWHLLALSRLELFQQASEQLQELAPDSAYSHALVARSRALEGEYSTAVQLYKRALARDPHMPEVYSAMAGVYKQAGRPGWAAEAAEKQRRLGPPDCAVRRLACEFLAGRYEKVTRTATGADDPESLYWRARAYSELALQALDRLRQLPPSAELHLAAAESYRLRRQYAEAVRELRAALRLAPGDPRGRRQLAETLWLSQDYEAARALLEELAAGEPDDPDLHYLLGAALIELQQPGEAIPHLKKALEKDPDNLNARASLGWAHLLAGEPAEAIPYLEAARAIDADGTIHFRLARAYQRAGLAGRAKETLSKSQQLRQAQSEGQGGLELPPP